MNPLVLIGLCLFLVYGVYEALLKAKVLKPVKPEESSGIIRMLLSYSFWLAFITVILGFAYAGLKLSRNGNPDQGDKSTITQQAGPCSSNVAGNGNTSHVDCGNKDARTK